MSVCRPFLKTGNTLAILNLSGTTPVAKDALKIVSKGFDITVFKSIWYTVTVFVIIVIDIIDVIIIIMQCKTFGCGT